MAYINATGQLDNQLGLLSRIQSAQVTLTSAQVIAMNATPVQILPAPGANLVYHVVGPIGVQVKPGGTQFSGGGVVTLVYTGGSINPHASSIPAATINSATASNNLLPVQSAVIQPPSNTGLSITNATGAFSAGTGSVVITVRFIVHTVV
jgi:hypothetical protein